jgi:hypothetical protein
MARLMQHQAPCPGKMQVKQTTEKYNAKSRFIKKPNL